MTVDLTRAGGILPACLALVWTISHDESVDKQKTLLSDNMTDLQMCTIAEYLETVFII